MTERGLLLRKFGGSEPPPYEGIALRPQPMREAHITHEVHITAEGNITHEVHIIARSAPWGDVA